MKTKYFILAAFLLTILIELTQSCTKKDNNCKSCKQSENFKITKVRIKDYTNSFTTYISKQGNISFSYVDDRKISKSNDILKELGFSTYFTTQNSASNIIGVVVYTKNKMEEDVTISTDDVLGTLIYFRAAKNLKTEFYYKESNTSLFAMNKDFCSGSNIISSNDIRDVGKLFFGNQPFLNAMAVIDFSSIPKLAVHNSSFQLTIAKYKRSNLASVSKLAPPPGGDSCLAPCEHVGAHAFCAAHEPEGGTEHWYCAPRICTYRNLLELIPGYSDFSNTLYEFVDTFLLTSAKGREYIDNYYLVSEKNADNLSLGYAVQALDIISSDIIPIVNQIINNPGATTILFDRSSADRIIAFCMLSKLAMTDEETITIIDGIINDINNFVNKPVYQVVNEFSQ